MFDLTVYPDLTSIEPAWRDFERRAVVLRSQWFDWVDVWFELFGSDHSTEPCPVVVADDGGVPILLLPLGIQTSNRTRTLTWMGGRFADQNAPLIAVDRPGVEAEQFDRLWRQIKGAVPRFDRVHLRRQPKDVFGHPNPFAAGSTDIDEHSWSTHVGDDWETYYTNKFSGRRRGDSRRKLRRLGEIGDVTFRVLDDTDDLDAFWSTLIAYKRQRFDETGKGDLFADGRAEIFYRKMTDRLRGTERRTHMSVLQCGDTVIGAHWGVIGDGVFRFIMPSFAADEWAKYSPGRLHIELMIQWCCENGIEEFTFGTGAEPFKKEWSEIVTPLYVHREAHSLSARARSLAGRAMRMRRG